MRVQDQPEYDNFPVCRLAWSMRVWRPRVVLARPRSLMIQQMAGDKKMVQKNTYVIVSREESNRIGFSRSLQN